MKANPPPEIKLNTWLLPILVGVLFIMQLTFPYKGWQIMLVGLGGLWLVSYLWVRKLSRSLSLTREMRYGWAHVGDRLEERFTLINASFVPVPWVEVIDQNTMPNYTTSRVTGIDGNGENRWITQGLCTRRGIFTLGPTLLHTGDPFNVFSLTLVQPDSTTLTVTPPVVPLPLIEVAPGGRAGEGRPKPNSFERTVSSAGVRDYIPGDSQHWIHWPTSARQGSLYVRTFDSMPAGDWWLFLDLEQETQVGVDSASTEEHAIILAASLADRGLRAGRAVGLMAYGQELVWLPPKSGDTQRREVMRSLAIIQPGPRPLAELLTRTRITSTQASSLIIITASTNGNWIEALLPLLRRGAVATVLLLDPVAFAERTAPNQKNDEAIDHLQASNQFTNLLGQPEGDIAKTDENGKQVNAPANDKSNRWGVNGHINQMQGFLTDLGVTHYLITPDLLDRTEVDTGQQGRWKWQISPSGRAIPRKKERDMEWRSLE